MDKKYYVIIGGVILIVLGVLVGGIILRNVQERRHISEISKLQEENFSDIDSEKDFADFSEEETGVTETEQIDSLIKELDSSLSEDSIEKDFGDFTDSEVSQ
jgi:hypothetical protein